MSDASHQITLSNEERKRITSWVQGYKIHKPFQQNASSQLDVASILASTRPEENPQNEFFSINLNHVNNLKLPSKPN